MVRVPPPEAEVERDVVHDDPAHPDAVPRELPEAGGCEREPEHAWRANVGGTEQVARTCRAMGARLVVRAKPLGIDAALERFSEQWRSRWQARSAC